MTTMTKLTIMKKVSCICIPIDLAILEMNCLQIVAPSCIIASTQLNIHIPNMLNLLSRKARLILQMSFTRISISHCCSRKGKIC